MYSFKVYVTDKEHKFTPAKNSEDEDRTFPVLAVRDVEGVTELLVSDRKNKLTWVNMKNTLVASVDGTKVK